MADFNLIFLISLGINIIITLRSSGLYTRLLSKFSSSSFSTSESDVDPLVKDGGGGGGGGVSTGTDPDAIHRNLLYKYLFVYLLGAISDWFQGPYVYALYDAYGFNQHDIAVLFVAGFGSSMIFGSFVGGLADGCGRRKFVVLYAITYAASCATKHFNDYGILMIGRLLGGIATSLLFSVFDSWLIRAHSDAGIEKTHLAKSFSSAAYGNSIVAIIAGLIANRVASMNELLPFIASTTSTDGDNTAAAGGGGGEEDGAASAAAVSDDVTSMFYKGGFLNPFDVAFITLCICGVGAMVLWEENYGDDDQRKKKKRTNSDSHLANVNDDDDAADHNRRKHEGILFSWKRATATVFGNIEILLCGIISSLFEGSMYVFVFMWTPALKALVATTTATAIAAEAAAATVTTDGGGGGSEQRNVEEITEEEATEAEAGVVDLPFGLIFSTFMVCCMAGSSIFSILIEKKYKPELISTLLFITSCISMLVITLSNNDSLTFIFMNIFEINVGIYFPSMGTLKSLIVPENSRSAIYNLFRIPLNFIVLLSLLTDLSPKQSFGVCTGMLGTAALLQLKLMKLRSVSSGSSSSAVTTTTTTAGANNNIDNGNIQV